MRKAGGVTNPSNPQTAGERITALETEVHFLSGTLETELKKITACLTDHTERDELVTASINTKLEALLTLRNKGFGAFWAASVIFGTGIVGAFVAFVEWLRNG